MKIAIKNLQRYLRNYALWYVGRYSITSSSLRDKLLKKGVSCLHYNNEDLEGCVNEIIDDFCRLGYIDDYLFIQNKLHNLLQRGKSVKYIKSKLRVMGLSDDLIKESLNVVLGENESQFLEEQALSKFILKKRILEGIIDFSEIESKKIASLVRAGFSFNLVVRVLKEMLKKG